MFQSTANHGEGAPVDFETRTNMPSLFGRIAPQITIPQNIETMETFNMGNSGNPEAFLASSPKSSTAKNSLGP